MKAVIHLSDKEIKNKLSYILESPKNNGSLKQIVSRPDEDIRVVQTEGKLTFNEGLKGDSWNQRASRHTPDNSPYIESQLTIMNSRVIASLTQNEDQWSLAGDQLFVDLDLSSQNLPAGSRLKIGNAVVEVSKHPHNGCGKFKERFGSDALKFVNSALGKDKHFRGVNAKVIKEGKINTNAIITKLTY